MSRFTLDLAESEFKFVLEALTEMEARMAQV